jgi:cytochrome c2
MNVAPLAFAVVGLGLAVSACRGSGIVSGTPVATGGDPRAGHRAIDARHCGVCHDIPGVTGAAGVVGPPLDGFARRTYIPSGIPNTPANLVSWIRDPRQFCERTAMPNLGLNESEARDVAAYLYTLR